MRIRVSDPAFTDELVEDLRRSSDAIVDKVGEDELEVSLIGSLETQTMQMEIYLRIRAWEAAPRRKNVSVEIVTPTDAE